MLLFRTLGSVDLRAPQGTPVDALLQQPRRLALLAYLAAAGPGTMVRRDRLLLLFWPELDEGRGRAALSQALHVLRRSLGAPVILTRGNEEVGLEPSAINADIAGFLEALARQDWAAADRLYAGDFLPAFHLAGAPEFSQWLDETRGHLRGRARHAATTLATEAERRGEAAEAVHWSRRALAHDPLDETLLRALLTRLAAVGDRSGAARAYEEFAARLARDLELEPSAETTRLRDAILDAPEVATTASPALGGAGLAMPAATVAVPVRPAAARGPLLALLLLVALAAGAAGAIWATRRAAASRSGSEERILVLPFAVRGDSTLEYLHEGMVDLLSSRLEAYGVLRVVDPAQVLAHLAEEEADGRVPTPKPALAQALAERYDAGMYLTGTVLRLGQAIEITAVLHDREGVSRATVSRQATSETALGQAADAVVRELLGRRWSRPADRLLQLAVVETESSEALRAYLEAEQAFRQGEFTAARDRFLRATEADSLFALAYYRLSVTGGWLADTAIYVHAAERAVALADRVRPRDAALMRAHLAYVQGRIDQSEAIYRDLVRDYPDDAEAWYNLGELLFHQNPRRGRPMAEARVPFERAAALFGPNAESAQHLVALRLMAGEREGLVASIDSVLHLLPPASPRRASFALLRALAGGGAPELAAALRALQERGANEAIVAAWVVSNYTERYGLMDSLLQPLTTAATQPPMRAAALGLLAHAAAARGDGVALRRALDRLALVDPATALETRAWLLAQAWVAGTPEERAALRRVLEAAAPQAYLPAAAYFTPGRAVQPAFRRYLGALLALRDADTTAAERALARLRGLGAGTGGPALAGSLHAELMLARGRPDVALAELDRHPPIPVPDMPQFGAVRERLLRGRALAEVGRYDEAVGWLRSCRAIFSYDFAWRAEGERQLAAAARFAADTLRSKRRRAAVDSGGLR
ncbi:MAG: tetratricopeptide repeat protein [Gemmatimonadetes bacterium]|nr:tetratricopeptide repeat protein [Gemmatimonadota bacterium]